MNIRQRKASTIVAAIACIATLVIGVPGAFAWQQQGEINNSQKNAFWHYNWTESYAGCEVRGGNCNIDVWQDGKHYRASATGRGQIIDKTIYGIEQLTNDGARAW